MLHNKLDIITTNMPQNQESLLHISAPNSRRIKELINGNLLDKEYISYLLFFIFPLYDLIILC